MKGLLGAGVASLRDSGLRDTSTIAARILHNKIATRFGLYRGESFMKDDWDLLIVLDACRVDALQEVSPDFHFLPEDIPARYSVGSASDEWILRTFENIDSQVLRNTIQITANPNTVHHLSRGEFQRVEEVWENDFDADLGTTPPRPVTDRAIKTHRDLDPDRLIAHYMQPHFPSIPESLGFGIRKGASNPDEQEWIWGDGLPDQYTYEDIWNAYIANLRYVLQDVELLLNNIDAETAIITADHGNAYGEWGVWGHPNQPLKVLRRVPEVTVSGVDRETHQPDRDADRESDSSVEEKLRALGYRT